MSPMYIPPVTGSTASQAPASSPAPAGGSGFQRVFDRLLEAVGRPHEQADQALRQLASGQTENLHQVLLTVANADLVFRLAIEVRNRLTESWQELQRMQV
jgi:flagellar hook-basal body complex protein FliE